MKVLILTHYFQPHIGGIEIVAYNHAKEIIKRGHQVTIITSKIGKEVEEEIIDGIKVVRVKALNFFENHFGVPYPIFYPKLLLKLKEEIKNSDVINTHGIVWMHSFFSAIISRIYQKPIVLNQHNTYINYKNPILRLIEKIADKTVGRYTLNSADHIIVVSEETKKYVLSIAKKLNNISILYSGVNSKRFKPIRNKKIARKKFKINLEGFICFTIRRITFKNGIDTFLQVAKFFNDKRKDMFFVLGGTGPDTDMVKKYIRENHLSNIKLLGFVSNEELPDYYALSDIFILPSKTGEGFPMVVIEAFASGLPVISTNTGGQIEIIRDDQTGFIVEPNKSKQIAKKIEYLSENKKLLKEMSENCRKLIEKEFTWGKNVDKLLSVYQEVLKNATKK
ncbi:D-inositol-3-phosphate glycosyltransferase [subsurface metagenome]